jgi:hypothetical protein
MKRRPLRTVFVFILMSPSSEDLSSILSVLPPCTSVRIRRWAWNPDFANTHKKKSARSRKTRLGRERKVHPLKNTTAQTVKSDMNNIVRTTIRRLEDEDSAKKLALLGLLFVVESCVSISTLLDSVLLPENFATTPCE